MKRTFLNPSTNTVKEALCDANEIQAVMFRPLRFLRFRNTALCRVRCGSQSRPLGWQSGNQLPQYLLPTVVSERFEVRYHSGDHKLRTYRQDDTSRQSSSQLDIQTVDNVQVEEQEILLPPVVSCQSSSQQTAGNVQMEEQEIPLPTVVIVGRPNVGKSALFNRLTRRREALVLNTPDSHITRDFREGIAKLGDMRFKVLDTAGLETTAVSESVLARTAGLTSNVICKCQIALFLIDGRAGLHPLDAEVGHWLRKQAANMEVILVVNKAEGHNTDVNGRILAVIGEAYSLGFGAPVAVSAETGEGMADLFDCLRPVLECKRALLSLEQTNGCSMQKDDQVMEPKNSPLHLAIAGRPNVGKSTLVNALLREERVLTGPEPGLTRDSVHVCFQYDGKPVHLVDTAGWLERSKLKERPAALCAINAKKSLMRANIVALVLDAEEVSDAQTTMRHSEAALANWVTQEGRALVIVVNKMDLFSGKLHARARKKVMDTVPKELQLTLPQVTGVPIVFVSALKAKGREAIMRKVFEAYDKWCTRLSTSQLNRWLGKVMSRHPRRGENGNKIKYITQVKARPPTFVVFTTGTSELDETDLRFIASSLREDFNLGGIPIRVTQRNSKGK